MFDTLFTLFKKETSLASIQMVTSAIEDILDRFTEEYMTDKNAKNAAIDSIIAILNQHKDK